MAHYPILAGVLALLLPWTAAAQEAPASDAASEAATEGETEGEAAVAPAPDVPQVDREQSSRFAKDSPMLPEIVAAIGAEREALSQRGAALDQREAEIAFAASALREQANHLTALKAEIEGLLAKAEANHTDDVGRLVRIYRAMKPIEAAAILSSADLEVSVLVLAAMTERDSGPIFAKMAPERARAVSKIILQRSRLPGDQRLVNLKIN